MGSRRANDPVRVPLEFAPAKKGRPALQLLESNRLIEGLFARVTAPVVSPTSESPVLRTPATAGGRLMTEAARRLGTSRRSVRTCLKACATISTSAKASDFVRYSWRSPVERLGCAR